MWENIFHRHPGALEYMEDFFKYKWYLPFPTNFKVSQGPIYISDLPRISHWHIKVEIIWTFRTGITSILSKPADAGCPRGATFASRTRHVPFPSTSIIKFIIQYKLIYIHKTVVKSLVYFCTYTFLSLESYKIKLLHKIYKVHNCTSIKFYIFTSFKFIKNNKNK